MASDGLVDFGTSASVDSEPELCSPEPARTGQLWRILSGQSLLSIADQVVVSGVNFCTVVLIGRFLSKESLGIYSLTYSGLIFVRCIQDTLITSPYTYLHHRRGAGYAGNSLLQSLGLSTLFSIALLFAAAGVHLSGRPWPLLSLTLLMTVVGPLVLLREFARQLSFAHLRLRECFILDSWVAAGQIAGLAALISLGWLSVPAVFLVIGIAAAGPSVAGLWVNRSQFILNRDRWRSDLTHNWDFGRWLLAGHLLGSVTPIVVPWCLALTHHGIEAVGILAASAGVAGLSNTLVIGLNNLLSARAAAAFADGGVAALQRVLIATGALLVSLLAGFTFLFLMVGNQIALTLYGAAYADAGPVIAILSLGMLLLGVGIAAGNGLCVIGRPAANLTADAASFVALILAVLFLLVPYGVKGAAAASVIANMVGMTVRLWTYIRLVQQIRMSSSGNPQN